MALRFHLTFEPDWRTAPLAFWVHVPAAGSGTECIPKAPLPVQHKGYPVLHIETGEFNLQFSSLAQLDHFIEVMAKKPLPTSTQLSNQRGLPVGPNRHWLSRLPAELKAPRRRLKLVQELHDIRAQLSPLGEHWQSFSRFL